MSGDNTGVTSRRCKAMIDAGIDNPDSNDGINFCVHWCPYPDYCIVVESPTTRKAQRARDTANFARQLHRHGVSAIDISLIIRKSIKTVRNYIRV